MDKTDKRLKNLIPWKKGQSGGGKSPGRPSTRKFAEYLREQYELNPDPANMDRLLAAIEKKCPDVLAYYMSGKPKETISLEGKVEVKQVGQNVLEQARNYVVNTDPGS